VLLRRGRSLEGVTLGWNVAGIVVDGVLAIAVLAGLALNAAVRRAQPTCWWPLAWPIPRSDPACCW